MGNLFGGGRTFLSAIAIGERTFGHLTGKKAGGGRTFLSAIAIGERTFGHLTGKFIWRWSNFSFRDSYRRKNFWTPDWEKSWRWSNFSFRDSYRRKNFWDTRLGNLFGGGRTFLSAIAIGERTFGHLGETKIQLNLRQTLFFITAFF